jgi:hypothetical protein
MIRIGMCPAPKGTAWELQGNPHIYRLIESIEKAGACVVPLSREQLSDPRGAVEKYGLDALHLHWAPLVFDLSYLDYAPLSEALSDLLLHSGLPKKLLKGLGPPMCKLADLTMRDRIVRGAKRRIDAWIGELAAAKVPILWQQHDLLSHNFRGESNFKALADQYLHRRLFESCSTIVVHEESCLPFIFAFYGAKKPFVHAPIGRLSETPAVPRDDARKSLGLSLDARIFCYLGSSRRNRNPLAVVDAFQSAKPKNSLLLIASRNCRKYLGRFRESEGIMVIDRFFSPEEMRDLYCASDFIVNDAKEYLTSGVVRSAIGYGVPVIAYAYGSTIDMARGAVVEIGDEGLEAALTRAVGLSVEELDGMRVQARVRDGERRWDEGAVSLVAAYEGFRCEATE